MIKIFAFGAVLLSLAACDTIEGAGRDMQKAGAAVSAEAREAKSEL
ncbi:entericidin A/B family lipoprotein [Xinfangfangia sp. CPCC 101601]|uniref:Entericidin A/B family lipoprotein n=1 Tax=Pseudogemmobacter lacusdianii TaxID=3069608 RepID=A0ABU0VT98_9RHOB|nr:entericidin A/B family lipoprotein [Xinfangfangia sp. CPCC 101601]MDQ2064898.1 entericidin A/B family lipoprotein [Xinfangfangia sp. CPCC 101601]